MAKSPRTNEAPDEETGQDSITAASLDDASKQIVEKTKEKVGAVQGAGGLEKWNRPRINIYRYLATLYSFVIMGMNDAAYGVGVTLRCWCNTQLTFGQGSYPIPPFVGYTLAAILNNKIHLKFGQLGVATIAPMSGFGNGLEDGGWNSWIGNMENANELLDLLHGAYGAGGTISPLIATAMVTKGNWHWYTFYYLMVSPGDYPHKADELRVSPV
ncbi:hypothetical protein LARI1_G004638 [Lachnellula arida]|uniref:Uncharacterized protein n=1 Tax=Lachnellula arida TaxID=1316785 RepID=A0A8T9B9P8_9HELO|nr:hypothetical protein LARI1_G004638 [Lachnellula arida]